MQTLNFSLTHPGSQSFSLQKKDFLGLMEDHVHCKRIYISLQMAVNGMIDLRPLSLMILEYVEVRV